MSRRSTVIRRGPSEAKPREPKTAQADTPAIELSYRYLVPWLLLFVGSGCAALIYEIVWFQLLQLIIGSSSISLGILLGTFMGGMCLGSLLFARTIPPRRHPLRVYAALELGVGGLGVLILVAMPLVGGIYTAWGGEGVFGIVFRAIVAGICLLP